jgi:hypothetical protein
VKEENSIKTLTIRNLPPSVAHALEHERRRRGKSLNRTVIDLLSEGLGVEKQHSNGLARLAGTWDEEDMREFERLRTFGETNHQVLAQSSRAFELASFALIAEIGFWALEIVLA